MREINEANSEEMKREEFQNRSALGIFAGSILVALAFVVLGIMSPVPSSRTSEHTEGNIPPPYSTAQRSTLGQPVPSGVIALNPVRTEAVVMPTLIPPIPTPIPPTRTPMPPGWELLEMLANAPDGETTDAEANRLARLYAYLYDLEGIVIAQGESTSAACYGGPRGYRIEEVKLPGYVTLHHGWGPPRSVDKYWRITVYAGPFPANNQPNAIRIDNRINPYHRIGFYRKIDDDTGVTVLDFDGPLAYEGATIGIEYTSEEYYIRYLEVPVKVRFVAGRPEQARIAPTATPVIPHKDPITGWSADEGEMMLKTPGKTIARSEQSYSSCIPSRSAYRLEEVTLPQRVTFDQAGKNISTARVWRFTLYGVYEIYIGNMTQVGPWTVRIGGTPLTTLPATAGLVAIAPDPTLFVEGATISACVVRSFGPGIGDPIGDCEELPEKLSFANRGATAVWPSPNPTEAACLRDSAIYDDLYTRQGHVVAQMNSALPTCFRNLTGYRIEEVRLPTIEEFEVEGEKISADRYWRVTLYTAQFPENQSSLVIWVGGTPLDVKKDSGRKTEVTAITFDGALIREGASIELSQGEQGLREALPYKLHLSDILP